MEEERPARWANSLRVHAEQYFRDRIEKVSLLAALEEAYGEEAPDKVEKLMDRLVTYCTPFWQYDADKGIGAMEGRSLIGVAEKDAFLRLIPPKYRDESHFSIEETGFKDRIDVVRYHHGLPAHLLRHMEDYREIYEQRRKGMDPLHVVPGADDFEDLIPQERVEARRTFDLALHLGVIVPIGSWYYFDPEGLHKAGAKHLDKSLQIAQGKLNAKETFSRRNDWVAEANERIEQLLADLGKQQAIELLRQKMREIIIEMGKVPPRESEIRKQYGEEIQAVKAKLAQSGYFGES
jgi:hypothetical protein